MEFNDVLKCKYRIEYWMPLGTSLECKTVGFNSYIKIDDHIEIYDKKGELICCIHTPYYEIYKQLGGF